MLDCEAVEEENERNPTTAKEVKVDPEGLRCYAGSQSVLMILEMQVSPEKLEKPCHSSGQTLAATPRDSVFLFLGKTEVDGPRFVDPLSALLAEDPELDILGSRSRSKPDFDDAIKHFGDSTDSSNSDSRYYV